MDDTNNVISSDDTASLQPYIDKYFKLLENFYHINKLKINPEKSRIMIVCRPAYRGESSNIVINTELKVIKQVQKLKALGMFITSGLSNHANINHIISKVNYRLSILKGVFKFAEKRTKLILINSLIISVFRYCSPLLIDSNCKMIDKLQTLLMKCTRRVLGFKSYKMSTVAIMRELKMVTIHHLVVKEAIQFVHKIIFNGGPKVIYKLFTLSRCNNPNIRGVRKPMMAKSHPSNAVNQSIFYRSIYLYNYLDYDIKMMNPKKLSKYLQQNIQYIFPNNRIFKVPRDQ